jgi:hypothetical protein
MISIKWEGTFRRLGVSREGSHKARDSMIHQTSTGSGCRD